VSIGGIKALLDRTPVLSAPALPQHRTPPAASSRVLPPGYRCSCGVHCSPAWRAAGWGRAPSRTRPSKTWPMRGGRSATRRMFSSSGSISTAGSRSGSPVRGEAGSLAMPRGSWPHGASVISFHQHLVRREAYSDQPTIEGSGCARAKFARLTRFAIVAPSGKTIMASGRARRTASSALSSSGLVPNGDCVKGCSERAWAAQRADQTPERPRAGSTACAPRWRMAGGEFS
jgi:hypothetical protein